MPVWASDPKTPKGALRGAFCLALLAAPALADPLTALQAGTWGNESFAERRCADNPHVVQVIAADRLRFGWQQPIDSHLNGAVSQTFATILSRDVTGLQLRLDNETRFDSDGSPLVFDLYLSADGLEYCLTPRSWQRRLCPRPYRRCAGPALS